MIPIIFIPGVTGTAETFSHQISALWRYGPVMVASTLEGDTIGEMADAILANAPPRFALVGFSMGGYIAFEIMHKAPERVERLALVDTSARPDTPEQTKQRRANLERMKTEDPAVLRAEAEPFLLHPDNLGHEEFRRMGAHSLEIFDLETVTRQQQAIIARKDSRADLAKIAVPTLVVVGEADQSTPPELAREMADAIPGAKLVIIEKSGHMSPVEQPEAVNAALIDWITN